MILWNIKQLVLFYWFVWLWLYLDVLFPLIVLILRSSLRISSIPTKLQMNFLFQEKYSQYRHLHWSILLQMQDYQVFLVVEMGVRPPLISLRTIISWLMGASMELPFAILTNISHWETAQWLERLLVFTFTMWLMEQ